MFLLVFFAVGFATVLTIRRYIDGVAGTNQAVRPSAALHDDLARDPSRVPATVARRTAQYLRVLAARQADPALERLRLLSLAGIGATIASMAIAKVVA
jgi:hypothetical protein